MGSAAGEGKKALRIAAVDGDGATTRASVPPVEHEQHHRPAPLPAAAAAAAAASGVAASAGGSAAAQSCGGEEEDDEQVERFYALLANIRALRGLYSAGESWSPAAGRGRKRSREAEAPWRPAFRMEDFEEEVSQVTGDAAGCAVKKQQGTISGAVGARRPAVARARAAADDDHEEGDVADEARGRKLGRRVAAQG